MEIELYIERYRYTRYKFFKWRHELEFGYKFVLAFAFACLTGLLAQLRLYLPWTPVPVTGQTLSVMLSAMVLGRWGGVSQIIYIGVGAAGVPWFAGGAGGVFVLLGPTGGYLIGFILAAFFLGHLLDSRVKVRTFQKMLPLLLFANFVLIYIPGLIQLYVWLTLVKGTTVGLNHLLMMGLIPFIIGDLMKIFLASAIGHGITPKSAYGNEVDR
ncbi:MAG TPA: biotin transporter BioY [Thermoplasmata archaeon]|nr:biotin transporter BioY [Thermoplasmata archaeon]